MSKTHFDPYNNGTDDDEQPNIAICGTRTAEDYQCDADWKYVTCLHCINKKDRIIESLEHQEKMIADQMGDMVNWYENELQKERDGRIDLTSIERWIPMPVNHNPTPFKLNLRIPR